MTINMRRLEKLEAKQRARDEAESRATIAAFDAWLTDHASQAEQAAWQRVILAGPIEVDQLQVIGMTQDEYNAIMSEVGPCTEDDRRLVEALVERIPSDLLARLNRIGRAGG